MTRNPSPEISIPTRRQAGLSPFAASLAAGARAFAVDGALGPSLAPSGSAAFSTAMSAAELAFKTKLADAMAAPA